MVSFKECKKILNKKGVKYSDENIREIKDFLKFYAKLTFKEFYKKNDYEKSSHNVSCK